MWRTNVQSVLCLTQLVARGMVERKSGHIVNISSILASRVFPYSMVYASTKFAVRAISQGLRLELREHGIKVTEVAPGQVKTEIFRDELHPLVAASYKGGRSRRWWPKTSRPRSWPPSASGGRSASTSSRSIRAARADLTDHRFRRVGNAWGGIVRQGLAGAHRLIALHRVRLP